MKKVIFTTIALMVVALLASCQKEDAYNNVIEGEGGFSLAIKMDDSKTTATRAALTEDELRAGASVKIYKPAYQGLIREYTYGTMPEVVYLPASTAKYRVDVAAGEIVKTERRKANFEQKSYKGSAEFMVEAGNVTEGVAVTAKICNAITNTTFDPTIAENFQAGYTLTFALRADAEDADKLVYTADKSGQDGYFIVDNAGIEKALLWTFAGTLKDGTAFTKSGTIEPKDNEGNAVPLAGAKMTMNFKYTVKDGFLLFELSVDNGFAEGDIWQDEIIWEPVSTGIIPLVEGDPNIWAKFVTVSADVDKDTYDENKVYFQYRKHGETEWSAIGDNIKASETAKEGVYSTVLKGLQPNTQYEYQLVLYTKETTTTNENNETVTVPAVQTVVGDADNDGSADELAVFTTDSAPQIPNGNFEGYREDRGYPEFYYTGEEKWWDSGNAISASFNGIICKSDKGYNSARCALLQSQNVIIKFAAGNIFSGSSGGQISGTTHGAVHFGRPFTGRPTGIIFYIKYATDKIDSDKGGDLSGDDYDEGQFKVALGRWGDTKKYASHDESDMTSPLQVRTDDSATFWEINALPETIVYKDIITDETTGSEKWKKVVWKFDYKNDNIPTHIIISGAASRNGDYFEGSYKSKMWLDEIELLYDHPSMITEEIVEVQ